MWTENIYSNFAEALQIWKKCQLLSLQNFGSSHSYGCQLQQLTESLVPSRLKVALKAMLSTPIVHGNHCVIQFFGSSDSYRNVSSYSGQDLVVLKATVDRNVNSHCWHHWYLQKTTLLNPIIDRKQSVF